MIFLERDISSIEIIKERFDKANIIYVYNKYNEFQVTVDKTVVSNNIDMFIDIMKTRRKVESDNEES